MLSTRTPPTVDGLLESSIASLDIPDAVYLLAVARSEAVAASLQRKWESGVIYPQGSIRLGTAVRPIHSEGEYDIDLVCRREIAKASTTQKALKFEVGEALHAFVASGPEGNPVLREGKRCWTLDYPNDPFHLDALPAIPDDEAEPDGILLTDRELRNWLHSNPVAYSEWFYGVMAEELLELRAVLAERMEVEDVPDWRIKTKLQRAVQALKRHRDIYFSERQELAPASIIITTLAGRAYRGGGDLYEAIVSVAETMPNLVEMRDGVYWVTNPDQPRENFADRWQAYPERADAFFEWIEVAHGDFASIGDDVGVDLILKRIGKSFGEDARNGAGSALGDHYRDARDRGELTMTPGSGALAVVSGGAAVPQHTFHGVSS